MGRELLQAIAADPGLQLAGVWMRGEDRLADIRHDLPGGAITGGDLDAVLEAADVAVDFTLPGATPIVIDAALRKSRPLVSGVSGLGDAVMARMREAASSIPVFHDRNMSFGVAVLSELVRRAGAALGPEFAAEIHETHHVHKVDAPSGTALKLGEALADARGQDFADVYRFGGNEVPPRSSAAEILFSAVREGENPGEHTVILRSAAESLTLAHKAHDRRVFALGALRAARWLTRQQPGLYGMRDLAATE